MKKKFITLFCTMFFSISVLAQTKEIKIWGSNSEIVKVLNEIAVEFNTQYKNVKVTAMTVDNVVEQFKTNALGGSGPDSLIWAHDISGDLAASGLIEQVKLT